MKTPRSTELAERLIVWTAIIVLTWLAGYEIGKTQKPAMECAKVIGMQPVSSTHDSCTYILGTQGRAHWKLMAKQESKK